jgi:hypothetical protein
VNGRVTNSDEEQREETKCDPNQNESVSLNEYVHTEYL